MSYTLEWTDIPPAERRNAIAGALDDIPYNIAPSVWILPRDDNDIATGSLVNVVSRTVYVLRVVVPGKKSWTKVSHKVISSQAATKFWATGFYNISTGNLLYDSGWVTYGTGANAILSSSVAGSLSRGEVWWAFAIAWTSAVPNVLVYPSTGNSILTALQLDSSNLAFGKSPNLAKDPVTAGDFGLPHNLGTISSTTTNVSMPIMVFT